MNLLINDNDFKKAVREEVEKVVGRDAKALVEQTIQNKLNAFAEIKDDDLFKAIKERIHLNSSWNSSRLQENITKTFEKNITKTEFKPKYELIGTHTARKTFICLAYERGLDVEMIKSITGITREKTLRRYLHISNETKKNKLSEAFANL